MDSKDSWESLYSEGKNYCMAPYTEIFSFLARNFGNECHGEKLLELGCGVGNNLIFAKWAMGFEVYGMDYSPTAIKLAKNRFDKHNLEASLEIGSIDSLDFCDEFFDVVIDRGAIQHNPLPYIRNIISEVERVLKPTGLFYSGLASDEHYLFGRGTHLGGGDFLDKNSEGIRHFFSKGDVLDVFSNFEICKWYKTSRMESPENITTSCVYHLEMKKKLNSL